VREIRFSGAYQHAFPPDPWVQVIPPKGWSPHSDASWTDHNFAAINILPIKQHAFVQESGAYQCILEEQRTMSAADFRTLASDPHHCPPGRGHREDAMLERSFWRSVTLNPPLYGADVPASLFPAHIPWGWNLRDLGEGDILREYDIPEIPGVTSSMIYLVSERRALAATCTARVLKEPGFHSCFPRHHTHSLWLHRVRAGHVAFVVQLAQGGL